MLSKASQKCLNSICFRYAVNSTVYHLESMWNPSPGSTDSLVCVIWCTAVLRLPHSAGSQRATSANTADLHFRPDVDWWAGGASDSSETWRELAQHARTPVKPSHGLPSEKVAGKVGRSSRLFHNPFQGVRELRTCLDVMLENRFDAALMTRVVGVHTLQKAANSKRNRNHHVSTEDIDLVCRFLSPLLEPEPIKHPVLSSKHARQVSEQSEVSNSRAAAVLQLRHRGAVLLLYSLAKLKQVRNWRPLTEEDSIQSLIQLVVQRLAQLTSSLDAQGVSNSLYALALLQCRADRLIAGLTIAADSAAPQMDAQQLSNSLWALARLDVALPDTLLTLTRALAKRQANSQDMGNAIWALAYLDCTSTEQLQSPVGKLVMRMLRPLPPVPDERVSRGHLSSFAPRHHIHVLWGLSKLQLHSTPLYESSVALLMPQMADVGDRGLAMLASVFGGGSADARKFCRLALPLLCSVGDSAKKRVLKGSIVPDALAQCIWDLWLAAKVPAGCKKQMLEGDRTLSAKRILAAATSNAPFPVDAEGTSVGSLSAGAGVLMLPGQVDTEATESALSMQSSTHTFTATPQALLNCVGRLISALGSTRPEVADRLLGGMLPRQKLQVLAVATDQQLLSQGGDILQMLERMASPLQSAVVKMNPSEIHALCRLMSKSARNAAPLPRDLVTAVVAHVSSSCNDFSRDSRKSLIEKLGQDYELPIRVQRSVGSKRGARARR